MKKVFGLFLSLIVLMGLWSCNQKELDNLQSQIDELKSVQIASINAQIAGIQSSIESMEKMDEQLKTRIDELTKKQQELESTDAEQAQEIAALKESLKEKEASLSKRIDELKSYVEEELKNQKDWVSATFSTLAQYQSTCDEIAALKLAISAQETTLRELISTTESSIKTWVNEQLSGYYTIAEMDAKISQLSKSIADGDAAQAAELEKLRAELEAARTDIKTAYEKAIEEAITTSEGKINEKIARDIKSATDAIQGQIDELNTKIADIEKRLGLVEASLEKILSQVQSIVVMPTYSDGTVGIKESEDTEIRFEVSPRSASIALAKQGPEVFSLDAVSTQTKASMFVANFPIKSVSDDEECLVVKLDAAKMDMAAVYANPSMSARLKIDDGNSSMTTNYFNISVERSQEFKGLTFVSTGESTISLVEYGCPYPITLEYSTNGSTWMSYTIGETISLSNGEKLMFREGEQGNNYFSSNSSDYYKFKISGNVAARGNIMSLLDRNCARNSVPSHAFENLFSDCQTLTTAPDLPAMVLAKMCYGNMFSGCTSLTKAPDLPATKLAPRCYLGMFCRCTSLIEAPALLAMNLAEWCYREMFCWCTSLTESPDLPATVLDDSCYWAMFECCTSLTKAPDLPATKLANYCYHNMFFGCTNLNYVKALFTDALSEETTTYGWLSGVASNGTFVKSKDATWDVKDCGIPKGWTVVTE